MKTIFRANRNRSFTQLSNAFLQDAVLSWEARGMLSAILSRPLDWGISISGLIASGPASKDKVRRIVQELLDAGYLRRIVQRKENGRYEAWTYIASDDPLEIKDIGDTEPLSENTEVDAPIPENPPPTNKDSYKQSRSTNKDSPPNPLSHSEETSPPEKETHLPPVADATESVKVSEQMDLEEYISERDVKKESSGRRKRLGSDSKGIPGEVAKAFSEYNALAREVGIPVARMLTPHRKKKLIARLRESGLEGWKEALEAIRASSFCRGGSPSGWKASIDFLLQPTSFCKLIENTYAGSATYNNRGKNDLSTLLDAL